MRIEMARGDSHGFTVGVYEEGAEETPIAVDNIFFTVKKHYYDKNFVIQKRLDEGTITEYEANIYTIMIDPSDTDDLDFGKYDFDIEVIIETNKKKTFSGVLDLLKEVTHRRNEVS